MNMNMKDRVAIVTGGSKGIGLAVARAFATAGAKVAIVARGAPALEAAQQTMTGDGLDVRGYVCDVAKAADITAAHAKIVADFGQVDILVNNAGTSKTLAFESVTDEILAGRSRFKTVRGDPDEPTGMAGHERAALGPHHQCAQYLRQGRRRPDRPRPRSRARREWR